jgi:hypothetical protein
MIDWLVVGRLTYLAAGFRAEEYSSELEELLNRRKSEANTHTSSLRSTSTLILNIFGDASHVRKSHLRVKQGI